MLEISVGTNGAKDCTEVSVKVNTDLPCEKPWIPFAFNCDRQYSAQLLAAHIASEMKSALSAIRRAAYEKGWADAKAKKAGKRNMFCGHWRPDAVGRYSPKGA